MEKKETDQRIEFSLDRVPFIILYKNVQNKMSDLSQTALNVFVEIGEKKEIHSSGTNGVIQAL